jgi:plasmid stabilization system protein ParE
VQIKITNNAERDYYEIRDFLMRQWNETIANDFYVLIEEKLKLVLLNPEAFPYYNAENNIRKVIIHKNVTMYYVLKSEEQCIYIISFFDNRQDPNSKRF